MAHRFRFIGEKAASDRWRLDEDEARHLSKILRLGEGAVVEVTDGRGIWAEAEVTAVAARSVELRTLLEHREPAERAPLVFAMGALKPGSVDEILPTLTELGVDRIWIFQQRENAKSRLGDKVIERWQRIVAQAVKQCKRAWLPEVRTFPDAASVVAAADALFGSQDSLRILLAAEAEQSLLERLEEPAAKAQPGAAPAPRPVVAVAGAEKGLSPEEERSFLEAGYLPTRISPYVLRAVTAAVAACSVLSAHRASSWPADVASC